MNNGEKHAHDYFSLHYGNQGPYEINEADQHGLVELMKKMLPGGAMGGYAEPGFPLYFINDGLLKWLGYTYDEFIEENGQEMVNTIHPDDRARVEAVILECLEKSGEYMVEYRIRKKDGAYIWVRDAGRKTIPPSGRLAMISIIVDISDEKKKQQSFENTIESMKREKRRIDRMTGLLNREPAESLIREYLGQNRTGALFLMDLDNFKLVNDAKGHPAGDQVLRYFSDQIKRIFPSRAVLSRWGGDEFIAYVPEYDTVEYLQELADQILICSANLIEDSVLANVLGVSIGIALVPNDGEEFGALYCSVDKAQYYAKRNGKGRYSFYGQESGLPAAGEMKANMNTLRRMVHGTVADKGAFLVEYEAFHKIYQFMERNIARMEQNTQLLLFTMHGGMLEAMDDEALSVSRKVLENSIRYRLRNGDLLMEFSTNQIAVLLVNCDNENAVRVASRILDAYRRDAGASAVGVTYEFGSMKRTV